MLRNALREILKHDWSQTRAVSSLPCTVAIAICLAIGLAIDRSVIGLVAASGAMSVGFGSFQRLGRSRNRPMLWASIGMAVFTAAGSLAGHSLLTLLVNSAVVGFFYGMMTAVSGGSAWISLQCGIFALVATAYPASLSLVLGRASLILFGGLLQLLLVRFFRRMHIGFNASVPADTYSGLRPALHTLRENLGWQSVEFRYALRLAATLVIATLLAHALSLPNSYWVPMTALLVLRTALHETLTRGVARMVGTVVGAGLATQLISLTRPGPASLALLVVLFAWLCYSTVTVSYGTLSASVTAYVACLLALGGLPEKQVALHRVANTCLGGTLALVISLAAAEVSARSSKS